MAASWSSAAVVAARSASARRHLPPHGEDDTGSDWSEEEEEDGGGGEDIQLAASELGSVGLGGTQAYELQDRSPADHAYVGSHDADHEGRGSGMRLRRLSESTAASFQLYTPDEEQAVIRKFDRRLVLFLSACYMLSFLDRSNIGNARLAGMEQDLQSRPPRDEWYEWSLTSFYIAYIVFEWMSLLFKVVKAHIYISLLVVSWGITASLQSVATSYPILICLRFLLGIGEAGFTGVPLFLSSFYKKNELAFRTALFISSAPLATTFASSLAWLILKIGEASPVAPWRLLFLLEGFPSVIIGLVAWNVVPDSPQTAPYLTTREKKVAALRLRREEPSRMCKLGGRSEQRSSSGLNIREVLSVFRDPKAWITAVMFFLANMAYSSLPVFLPTILKDMGHSAVQSQALSAPPHLIAFVTVLITAHLSDRTQARASYIIAHALMSAGGYAILALARPLSIGSMIRYLAVYPAAVGFFSVVVLIIAWLINNQPTESRKGGGFALLQVVGQCGPLVGTRLYPTRDEPYFEPGMWACAGAMTGVALMALLLRLHLARENKKLDESGPTGDREEARGLVADEEVKGRREFRFML